MRKVLTVIFSLVFSFLSAQTYKYEFKVENVSTQAEAKTIFDDIRFFFNTEDEPFKYPLKFREDFYFEITTTIEESHGTILNYFISKNIMLTELNIYYYE